MNKNPKSEIRNPKLIFLIGFMGSGKTSVGKKLAALLSAEFVDLDEVIELKESKTISQIFQELGEEYFRERESQCLQSLSEKSNAVIATGGGVPYFHDNMKWMNENGVTVYLQTNSEILFGRLKSEIAHRPLLHGNSEEELKQFIKILQRCDAYLTPTLFVSNQFFIFQMNRQSVSAGHCPRKLSAIRSLNSLWFHHFEATLVYVTIFE
ncbi:MAG: shikimate kinase [Chitinophagales bacterium]